jgi:hypothetical protein
MIVWGGHWSDGYSYHYEKSGGRYDPLSDSWLPTSIGGDCPSARSSHTAVWTGTEMIVWGGSDGSCANTGGRYSPSADSWVATSLGGNCPVGREGPTSVWTGEEMIVWGGYWQAGLQLHHESSGGRYSPSSDSWLPASTQPNAPENFANSTAAWTGTEMIVWGGEGWEGSFHGSNTGARYTPSSDSWASTSTAVNCPNERFGHSAVWTGTALIVWGGSDPSNSFSTGGRYDPVTDTWLATSTGANCPTGRYDHTAVWTGTEMVIWGGRWFDEYDHYENSGGCYAPATNSWMATSTGLGCPIGRSSPTGIWTGTEMIVWGGYWYDTSYHYEKTGGRFNPSSNSWELTSIGMNCPAGRAGHTAAWTGTEMIVWGGLWYDTSLHFENTGGRFAPLTNSWISTSTGTNCPTERYSQSSVWTGTEMIIWGGSDQLDYLDTGGRYFPSTNSWVATAASIACPARRDGHTAVWTGAEMIVWGGRSQDGGGIYVPPLPEPAIAGDPVNSCPGTSVALSAGTFAGYQWNYNGMPFPGATAPSLVATVSGTYSVTVVNSNGCEATSADHPVSISFCSQSEVSPSGALFAARLQKDLASPTGFYLYFQRIDSVSGYNLYEGIVGAYYSHDSTAGNVCDLTVTDLGTGEIRAEILPGEGNHYYLVTAFDGGAEGPSGFDSSFVEIPASQSTCGP